MIIFPVFAELEKKRDEINAHFHKDTEPQLIERRVQLQRVTWKIQVNLLSLWEMRLNR